MIPTTSSPPCLPRVHYTLSGSVCLVVTDVDTYLSIRFATIIGLTSYGVVDTVVPAVTGEVSH